MRRIPHCRHGRAGSALVLAADSRVCGRLVRTAPPTPTIAALDEARAILERHPLIDGHNDLPMGHPRERQAAARRRRPTTSVRAPRATPTSRGCARAASAASSGRCTSRARPKPARAASRASSSSRSTSRCAMIERYPRDLALALTAADIERANAGGPHRLAARHGRRPRHRELARRAARLLPARRALHDAHALQHHRLGRLGDGRRAARRPHEVRRGGRAGDEPARHAGGHLARVGRHDERRARHRRGAGHLLALQRARALADAAQRAGRRARARCRRTAAW